MTIASAVEATADRFGGLDVLVANAVRWPEGGRGPLTEVREDEWAYALRANLEGTASTVRRALPHLSNSPVGRAVLISSGLSRAGMPSATAYATAKAGLDGLVAALKWEAGEKGVLVNIVSPGFTVTENNLARFPDSVRESVRERTPSRRLSVPGGRCGGGPAVRLPRQWKLTGTYLPVAGGID